jgi:pimeloyl-ACP methyl ester carboxylesterase
VQDVLVPRALAERLVQAITAPSHTVTFAPNAGHMVQFDQPEIVRAAIMKARNAP